MNDPNKAPGGPDRRPTVAAMVGLALVAASLGERIEAGPNATNPNVLLPHFEHPSDVVVVQPGN